jgi:acyl carrier protein
MKKKIIENWFERKLKRKLKKSDYTKNIFDSKMIDSFQGVELIIFLENKLKVKLDNSFIQNKKKQTIRELLKFEK